jgi:hypothetical protein
MKLGCSWVRVTAWWYDKYLVVFFFVRVVLPVRPVGALDFEGALDLVPREVPDEALAGVGLLLSFCASVDELKSPEKNFTSM